ncbi:GIY-YIG nuclease family protein [Lactiplantibacillus garii]|uniref:GIY-YIG nuclease family protein n=1 Tax=Lactiplantibacillus garii TaxID=2306423 RepID=A0A426D8E5_9LACO|nr:GIY-YIG nuclease family protein [Lactiplantibacillus garii]RRK10855.1 GIY-YIG nuclease family protein [Lactiplantibacillus garii]
METERKKQLQRAFKMAPTYYGVIQIENQTNHKIFIDVVPNLHNRWQFYQLNLNKDFYRNTPLQADWNEQGAANFTYSVLFKEDTANVLNMRATLKALKNKWLHKLTPFDDRGYNRRPRDWEQTEND